MGDAEQQRRDIGAERQQLVAAVETLREAASEARGKLKTRAPLALAGVVGAGLGLRTALRAIVRRGR